MIIIFLLLILIPVLNKILNNQKEYFSNIYLGQPTKCFDCERELPRDYKYLGGPTKCFSCEQQYIRMYGPEYADLAQPTKCFDCERQYL